MNDCTPVLYSATVNMLNLEHDGLIAETSIPPDGTFTTKLSVRTFEEGILTLTRNHDIQIYQGPTSIGKIVYMYTIFPVYKIRELLDAIFKIETDESIMLNKMNKL